MVARWGGGREATGAFPGASFIIQEFSSQTPTAQPTLYEKGNWGMEESSDICRKRKEAPWDDKQEEAGSQGLTKKTHVVSGNAGAHSLFYST